MEELMELLKKIKPEVDFETENNLVEDGLLASFDVIQIISAISKEFDVKITAGDVVPENFNSAQAMWDMIQRLEDE